MGAAETACWDMATLDLENRRESKLLSFVYDEMDDCSTYYIFYALTQKLGRIKPA
jgi:hypothetical protein